MRKAWAAAGGAGVALGVGIAFGPEALVGLALGLSSTVFNLWALHLAIGYGLSPAPGRSGPDSRRLLRAAVLGLAGLPVWFGAAALAGFLGTRAILSFSAGVLVVYFGLVRWGLSRG